MRAAPRHGRNAPCAGSPRSLAAALSLLAAAPAGAKVPPPPRTCTAGVTGFVDGRLRVFGLPWRTREEWGADHYACIGRGARPQAVGFEYSNTGTGTDDTPAYALGGGRYLAAYHYTDGEGGPSASISLLDLRARRRAGFVNVVCCEGDPAFLVGADGTMAAIEPGEGLWIKRPGGRARTYNEGVPRDLAMAGGTVYWREGAQARSAVLPGLGGDAESHMLEPMELPRRDRRCPSARGRTVAASASVRVVQPAGAARRFACRAGRRFAAGPSGAPAPRIVDDRWLLVHRPDGVRVLDTRSGEIVTSVDGVPAAVTLLYDGTLAWIDAAGVLRAQSRGAAPVELSAAATLVAAARRAVYWTEDGTPRVYRPSKAAAASRRRRGCAAATGRPRSWTGTCGSSASTTARRSSAASRSTPASGGGGRCSSAGSAPTTGSGRRRRPVYAHAGRYLASYSQSDSEGGPGADVTVVDLIRRRAVSFVNVACCEWTPAIRLATDGTVAVNSPGEGVFVKAPGRRARTLAGEGRARPRDVRRHRVLERGRAAALGRAAGRVGRRGDGARAGAPAPPRRDLRRRARPHDRRLGLRAGLRDARRPLRLPRSAAAGGSCSPAPRRRGSSATAGCSSSARAAPA